jgi:hypothetical protein
MGDNSHTFTEDQLFAIRISEEQAMEEPTHRRTDWGHYGCHISITPAHTNGDLFGVSMSKGDRHLGFFTESNYGKALHIARAMVEIKSLLY